MAIYVGVNGVPKEVSEIYVGVNGVPKEVSDVYGGKNNVATAVYSGVKPGETIFTSSGTFTVPKGVKKIDVFCVGGGGGARGGYASYSYGSGWYGQAAGGGGGGYTKTVKNIAVNTGDKIAITVGAGSTETSGYPGGASSAGNFCSANGGYWGYASSYMSCYGGSGGSGGGAASNGALRYGDGGTDGSNNPQYETSYSTYNNIYSGQGQGTTTRYFGESGGTLYSTGGTGRCGGYSGYSNVNGSSGGANTGNGASAGSAYITLYYGDTDRHSSSSSGGVGGSGIVIVRWSK
jgi:hypothetical protein